jgi:hypothetical protein
MEDTEVPRGFWDYTGLHRILTRIEKYKNSDVHYGIKRVKNIENKKK